MLTASFVTPSGLPVSLPSSKASTIVMQKVSVTITKDLEYYLNDRKININDLERELGKELLGKEGVVVLHADKSVPVEHVVRIAGIATSLEAKVTLATRPE